MQDHKQTGGAKGKLDFAKSANEISSGVVGENASISYLDTVPVILSPACGAKVVASRSSSNFL